MDALVVSNMQPSPEARARGIFVRDQVDALRRIEGVEVELFEFSPGLPHYAIAAARLRRRYRDRVFDIVHAHFGLTAWPALAVRGHRHMVTLHGTDVRNPRSRRLSLAAARHLDLVATVSEALGRELPPGSWGGATLPCGVNLERFRVIPREQARLALGLEARAPCLLFPADPARHGKRFDRAQLVAGDIQLLTLGDTEPEHVPLAINAVNAVIVPSDAEGFGLAVLEALACDVPVLATPVGIHAEALAGVDGTLCEEFDRDRWRAALKAHVADPNPRIDGRSRAATYSADRMAQRVAAAWRELLAH
jgi:glycosyltransferase involved in cell wall biosynthesis